MLSLTDEIADVAIELRRKVNIKLPDSLYSPGRVEGLRVYIPFEKVGKKS